MDMKFLKKSPDGGINSGTTAYFLIEIKSLFSIALLRFDNGSPERLHTHAFNAYTLWLKGKVIEQHRDGKRHFYQSGMFKTTKRSTFHKIIAMDTAWAISFRGPWTDTWQEDRGGEELITLTHGRKEV